VPRQVILVLGMHRSGTSLLAGALAHLGAVAPRTLMAANEHNPLGYWESSAFADFHDRLLAAAGTAWDLWSEISLDAMDPTTLASFEEEFRTLLGQEFGAAPLVVVKDPRICRLVRFWIQQLEAAAIDVRPVLIGRNPFEVAQSLFARDGLSREHALFLWLRHVLDAERFTRELPRAVIQYADVLSDWRSVVRHISSTTGVTWRTMTPECLAKIDSLVQPALRHHLVEQSPLDLPPLLARWITDVETAFRLLATDTGGSREQAQRLLDEVRQSFETVAPMLEAVVVRERHRTRCQVDASVEHARQQLQAATSETLSLRQQVTRIDADRCRLLERLSQLGQDHAALQRQVAELAAVRDELHERASHVERHAEQLREHELNLLSELDRLRQWSAGEVAGLSARAARAEKEVQALRHSRTWRWTAPLRAVASVLASPRDEAPD